VPCGALFFCGCLLTINVRFIVLWDFWIMFCLLPMVFGLMEVIRAVGYRHSRRRGLQANKATSCTRLTPTNFEIRNREQCRNLDHARPQGAARHIQSASPVYTLRESSADATTPLQKRLRYTV